MDKQAILNLLTKPSNNEAMFSEIAQIYLQNARCSANYAVISAVNIPPAPQPNDQADVQHHVGIHVRLYTEVLDVLIDKFNHYADTAIQSEEREAYVKEFIGTMIPFLHNFHRTNQRGEPETDENHPSMSIEITRKEDEENEYNYFAFCCTAIQHKVNSPDIIRQMEMRFYI